MITLTDFLLARIEEDEAVARDATPGPWYADEDYATVTAEPFGSAREAYDRDSSTDVDCWVIPESMDSSVGRHNLAHIARHDPARVLADCEARRRIVERYERLMNESKDMPSAEAQIWRGLAGESRLAMFDLARPYADHADYREEWKP